MPARSLEDQDEPLPFDDLTSPPGHGPGLIRRGSVSTTCGRERRRRPTRPRPGDSSALPHLRRRAGVGRLDVTCGSSPGEHPPTGDPSPFTKPARFRPADLPAPAEGRGHVVGVDWARLLPTVTLYVHLTDHTLATGHGVARWEGEGRSPRSTSGTSSARPAVHHQAGDRPRRPAAVDAYEVPTGSARRCTCAPRPMCSRTRRTPAAGWTSTTPGPTGTPPRQGRPGWTTSARSAGSTTGSAPTATGPSSSPSRASTSGAHRTAASTSSTTPAPARSPTLDRVHGQRRLTAAPRPRHGHPARDPLRPDHHRRRSLIQSALRFRAHWMCPYPVPDWVRR